MGKLRHGATHGSPALLTSPEGKPRQSRTPNLPSSRGPVKDEGRVIGSHLSPDFRKTPSGGHSLLRDLVWPERGCW